MTTTEEKPLHIIELRSSNVLRLRAVRIRPDGNMVIISGKNAQGKSSVLSAIAMALGGKRAIPEQPVRHGARKAETVLDLGELIVEQTITQKGTTLVVKGKDGVAKASPQTLLDKLTAAIAFDPFAFSRMDAAKQDKLLKELVGLDFSAIDAERAQVYAKRTEINKELERVDALLDKTPHHPDAPKKLVDVAALSAEIDAHTKATSERDKLLAQVDRLLWAKQEKEARVEELQRELEQAKAAFFDACAKLGEAEGALPPKPAPIDETREKLHNAEATNAKVRANAERQKLEDQAQEKADDSCELSTKIEELDAKKAAQLAAAKFPIDGLGFDESGPTFNGVPLAQASQAERLRVSVAIGTALNPSIRVMLVREGAFLDEDSFKLLAELAREKDVQIWVEVIKSDDPSAILIEDGEVVERSAAEEPANGAAAEA